MDKTSLLAQSPRRLWTMHGFLAVITCVLFPTLCIADVVEAMPRHSVHIGVIGEAARPGVYQLATGTATMGHVLNRAGGLTRRASGSVRIVRGNRLSHMIYVGTETTDQSRLTELLDGDVLIVDGFVSRSRTVQMAASDTAYGTSTANINRDGEPIPVALVGLTTHPIVIPVPKTHAHPKAILAYLGQSPELASGLQITSPALGRSRSASNTDRFTGPTVVSFEGLPIESNRLPELPPVFQDDLEQTAPSTVGTIGNSVPETLPTPPVLSRVELGPEPPQLIVPNTSELESQPSMSGPTLGEPAIVRSEEPTLIQKIRKIEEAAAARKSEQTPTVAHPVAERKPARLDVATIADTVALDPKPETSSKRAESWRMWKWVAGVTGIFLAVTFVLVRASQRWSATRAAAKTEIRIDRPHQTVEELLKGPHFTPTPKAEPTIHAKGQAESKPAMPTPKPVTQASIPLPKPKFASPRAVRHVPSQNTTGHPLAERSRFDDALANLSDAA